MSGESPDGHDDSGPGTDFHRRVLDQMPTPIALVDTEGRVVYGNAAMTAAVRTSLDTSQGRHLFEFVHPDDLGWTAEAFLALAEAGRELAPWSEEPWTPVPMRVVDSTGTAVHVEVTGAHSVQDGAVDGFIYEVRHGAEAHLLRQVLTGVAAGRPVDDLVQLVAEMIAAPPVRLDVVIAEVTDGHSRIVGRVGRAADVLDGLGLDAEPWSSATGTPVQHLVADLAAPFRDPLVTAGYVDWCQVAAGAPSTRASYRIAALTPYHHVPATGILQRLARATELLDIIELRAANDALLARLARRDTLTDLPNRLGLAAELDDADAPGALLFVDLDGFKPVNDRHGHAAGDHVLRAVARRLEASVRPGDVVARIGGDEFVVVLRGDPARTAAIVDDIAARILAEVARPVEFDGVDLRVSASIGVAVAPGEVDIDQLLASADAAMYAVKRSGGGGHRVATPGHG